MSGPDRLDLLLGSDIGVWMVDQVDPREVGTVITVDERVALRAVSRGLRVVRTIGDASPAHAVFSAHWPRVVSAFELARWEHAWNVHPGLLPWGRGYAPVFWAVWAGEPAGASLHGMTAGLDRGPIVAQRRVDVRDDETGGSLYRRVLEARQALVREWWPRLVAGERPAGFAQGPGGSYHDRTAFLALRDAPDVASMTASDLLRLCRALAMPGMPGPRVGPWRLGLAEGEPQ